MHVGIQGPGRLGRSLAALLVERGHQVSLIGRGESVPPDCEGLVLTVPDTRIAEVVAAGLPDLPVLHCSGAQTVDILRPHRPAGSFHPLMTFPGPEVAIPDLTGVPAVIDGDPEALALATALAETLDMRVVRVPGDRRLYHAAAVMAGNFATVLLAHAAKALEAAGVPHHEAGGILLPLAVESLKNAAADPAGSLTGPVARGDEAVIASHRQALADIGLSDSLNLYDALTAHTRQLCEGRG